MGILDALRRWDAVRKGDQVLQEHRAAVAPATVPGASCDGISAPIRQALERLSCSRLYEHQARAISAAAGGANVVLEAPTASGKSLAFQIPVLETLLPDPSAHALMIYPTKALAFDQRDQFRRLTDAIPGVPINSWWYDGDVPQSERDAIRKDPPQVLMTNPEMLNLSFLGHGNLWTRFLRRLKWVVLDEVHEYRGYFGSNVAMLLRRFRHYLRSLGADPQFFLSSATCANGKEHAEALTGAPFVEVSATGAMQPARDFLFVRPDLPGFDYWKIFQLRVVNAGLACLAEGKATLVFCPSRKFAEQCHRLALRKIEERADDASPGMSPEVVAVYRAGLTTKKRQDIQERLKQGVMRLVFATNALELGIDIGELDGVILAGFPDSIAAAWQRIGRAGRSWASDAFVLYFARNNPVDQFHASNLSAFLTKPLDELVVNPRNTDLIERHVPCLLQENQTAGGKRYVREILGPALHAAAEREIRHGAVIPRGIRPQKYVSLRGGSRGQYVLQSGNTEIGTMSAQQQFREAYERAIYLHGGRTFRVVEVATGRDGGTVRLREEKPWLHTSPIITTAVTMRDVFEGRKWGRSGPEALYGDATSMERIRQVVEVDEREDTERDRWTPSSNQARFDNAYALRISLPGGGSDESPPVAGIGVTTCQHLLRVGALFSIPIDAHDIFSHAEISTRSIFLVESYRGGIGIAGKALEIWRTILQVGMRVARECPCARGCPNCIAPPRSPELDKEAGLAFAERLLATSQGPHTHEFRKALWKPVR